MFKALKRVDLRKSDGDSDDFVQVHTMIVGNQARTRTSSILHFAISTMNVLISPVDPSQQQAPFRKLLYLSPSTIQLRGISGNFL